MLQWFGNLVMEMPVGMPVVAPPDKWGERGPEGAGEVGSGTAGATCDRKALMGKRHLQTLTC